MRRVAILLLLGCGLQSAPDGGGTGGGSNGSSDAGTATLHWELDSAQIATVPGYEAVYTASTDSTYVFLPHFGRNVQIFFSHVLDAGTVSLDCNATTQVSMLFSTADNSFSSLGNLPMPWRNLYFSNCTPTSGDTVARYHLDATVLPGHAVGSLEISVQGTGPRSGTTLHVAGAFDVAPEAM